MWDNIKGARRQRLTDTAAFLFARQDEYYKRMESARALLAIRDLWWRRIGRPAATLGTSTTCCRMRGSGSSTATLMELPGSGHRRRQDLLQ